MTPVEMGRTINNESTTTERYCNGIGLQETRGNTSLAVNSFKNRFVHFCQLSFKTFSLLSTASRILSLSVSPFNQSGMARNLHIRVPAQI